MPPVYNKYFLFKRCFALSGGDFFRAITVCEIRVNTHILTGIPRALIYLFSKRYARTETLFSGVFRPFPYSYVLFLSTFKLNDV